MSEHMREDGGHSDHINNIIKGMGSEGHGGWGGAGAMGAGALGFILGIFLGGRGGLFGGRGEGGAVVAEAFSTEALLNAMNSTRVETIGAVNSVAQTINNSRVESQAQLAALLTSITAGNNDVKNNALNIAAEGRGGISMLAEKLCCLDNNVTKGTFETFKEIAAATTLSTAQYNCVSTNLQKIECENKQTQALVVASEHRILDRLELMRAQDAAALAQSKLCALEAALAEQKLMCSMDRNFQIIREENRILREEVGRCCERGRRSEDAIAEALMSISRHLSPLSTKVVT